MDIVGDDVKGDNTDANDEDTEIFCSKFINFGFQATGPLQSLVTIGKTGWFRLVETKLEQIVVLNMFTHLCWFILLFFYKVLVLNFQPIIFVYPFSALFQKFGWKIIHLISLLVGSISLSEDLYEQYKMNKYKSQLCILAVFRKYEFSECCT